MQSYKKHNIMHRPFKVIHLELKADHSHHYFGSIKALCDNFDKDQIGIVYTSLRCVNLGERKYYENSKCIIRQGILVTTTRNVKPKKTAEPEI